MRADVAFGASHACAKKTGQRVQKSVFECEVDQRRYEALEQELLREINPAEDCLRLYRLTEPARIHVKEHGRFKAIDFDGPLVV